MLENHCTQTSQSSRGGCSRQVHKIEYLAVNKGNVLVNFLLLKIFNRELLSLINPAVYLLNKFFVGWVIGATAPELCQKCDFFLKKIMKEIFAYVLEVLLKFYKMQNTNPLMCTKFEIWGQSILEVIQAFHTLHIYRVFWPSSQCLNKINMKQSTTRPLGRS